MGTSRVALASRLKNKALAHFKTTEVELPNLGKVTLRQLSSYGVEVLSGLRLDPHARTKALALSVIDDDGELVYPGDYGFIDLGVWPADDVKVAFEAFEKLNKAEAVEEVEKNSEPTTPEGPSSS